ncbi:MAG: methyltransferase domain-containing protein [Anaerolineae bacterium]|jgi:ubiquinone/menaquinone biosynthesis C-methylase UbiE|nr:methyltransferase domain-containing protein [Anaerolineae bacterium]
MQGPFDPFATLYDSWFDTPLGGMVDLLEKDLLLRFMGPVAGQAALDVGTGTGHFALFLAGHGARVVGVDISRAMLRVAAAKPDMPPLVQADAAALPFADAAFDLVLSVTALEFVPDAARAAAEMARVCRKGGRLVLGVLNAWSPWAWVRRRAARRNPSDPFAAAHFFSPPEFVRLFAPHGKIRWSSSVFILPGGQGLRAAWLLERVGRKALRPFGALLVGRVDV